MFVIFGKQGFCLSLPLFSFRASIFFVKKGKREKVFVICYDCIYAILIYVIAFMFGRKFAATHSFILVNLIF